MVDGWPLWLRVRSHRRKIVPPPALASWSRQAAPTEPPAPQDVLFGKADIASGSIFRCLLLYFVLTNLAKDSGLSDHLAPDPLEVASHVIAVLVASYFHAVLYATLVKIAVLGISYWLFPARRALSLSDQESLADAQLSPLFHRFGSTRRVATAVWLLRGGPRGQYTASGVIKRFACALGLCWGLLVGGPGPLEVTYVLILAFQIPFYLCFAVCEMLTGVWLPKCIPVPVYAPCWANMRWCILACLAICGALVRPLGDDSVVPFMERDIAWAAPVSNVLYRTSTWTWLAGLPEKGRPRRATVSAMVALYVLHFAGFLPSVPRFLFFDVDVPYICFYIHARMWTLLLLLVYALTRSFFCDKDDFLCISPDEEDRRAWQRVSHATETVLVAAVRFWAWASATVAAVTAAAPRRPARPPPRRDSPRRRRATVAGGVATCRALASTPNRRMRRGRRWQRRRRVKPRRAESGRLARRRRQNRRRRRRRRRRARRWSGSGRGSRRGWTSRRSASARRAPQKRRRPRRRRRRSVRLLRGLLRRLRPGRRRQPRRWLRVPRRLRPPLHFRATQPRRRRRNHPRFARARAPPPPRRRRPRRATRRRLGWSSQSFQRLRTFLPLRSLTIATPCFLSTLNCRSMRCVWCAWRHRRTTCSCPGAQENLLFAACDDLQLTRHLTLQWAHEDVRGLHRRGAEPRGAVAAAMPDGLRKRDRHPRVHVNSKGILDLFFFLHAMLLRRRFAQDTLTCR